jgi:DNA-binding NtrC family response regulator
MCDKRKIRVLVLEDNEDESETICRGFSKCKDYAFELFPARSLEECLKKKYGQAVFDVCIIDLRLSGSCREIKEPVGLDFIAVRSFNATNCVTIVYSAHAQQTTSVVRAISLGAVDFISKAECPPDKLAPKVCAILQARERDAEEQMRLAGLVAKNAKTWHAKYRGRTLAIAHGRVVATGKCRLDAMMKYQKQREKDASLPVEPYFLGSAAGVRRRA